MNSSAGDRRTLWLLLTLAFALRAGLAVLDPGIAQPDEIFQYQEPAHKLLTGLGIPTWEWALHARSWLLPGLVLPVMALARLVTHDPAFYWALMASVTSAASLPVVWVAFRWGFEVGGRKGGIIAGFTAAVWFQLVYFSAHLLVDTLATDLLLPALYACREYRLRDGARALAWGSALLGVIVYLRPQLAPILLVPAGATLIAAKNRGQAIACLGWGLGPLLVLGVFDWITLGAPFRSVWLYIYVNLFKVTDEFGLLPWYWYLGNTLLIWSSAIVPIAYFSWTASRHFRLEFIVALLIIALMSAIGHKEPRFVLPALAILLILAGVGLGEFCQAQSGILGRPALYLPLIGVVSLGLAFAKSYRPEIQRWHVAMKSLDRIEADPQACGIYFLTGSNQAEKSSGAKPRIEAAFLSSTLGSAGYTGTRDGIRLLSDSFDAPAANEKHGNYLVTLLQEHETARLPAGYALQSCATDASGYRICVYHRPGGC